MTPRYPDVPERVEKRTIADLAAWPYPKQQLVPDDRGGPRPAQRGDLPGLHPGLPLLPGRHDHPAGPGAARRARCARWSRDGLRRTGYDEVSLTSLSSADFSGIDEVVGGIIDDPACRGQVSVSLPSLRVDAFTVGIATQIQKVRRTGLTFAPEAGTWRMRQVINKLIREEDLYGAVESAFSQGWRRVKLYFLTGLPTETDEDTLGIAELARNCVAVGRRHHRGRLGHRVGRRVRAQAADPVPVVRPGHRRPSCGARSACCATPPAGTGASSCAGTTPRRRWPRASPAGATAGSGRSSRRSGGGAAPSRSGRSTSRSTCGPRPWPPHGLSIDWYVHRHRDRDEVLPWAHISAGLHEDFLWQDWQDALAAAGTPDCRWTPCYDCGACTGYGLEHVVASPTPPAGGSQGTGQDLTRGAEVPVRPAAAGRAGAPAVTRVRIRFAKLGKIRWTSHRDVARMWERAFRRVELPLAYSAGFSPRPKVSFGLALPTGHESVAEYLDVELADARPTSTSAPCPAGCRRRCRSASTPRPRR